MLAESDHDGLFGDNIRKLEQDFLATVEEMPQCKARLVNSPPSVRQGLVDFAFVFFVGGANAVLDPNSKYNSKRSSLEFRRDLN